MREAFVWGLVGGSALILGGLAALYLPVPDRLLGLIMAFGSGVLISAVAYELVGEAFEGAAGTGWVAAGFIAGSLVFYAGDTLISGIGGGGAASTAGLVVTLGIVLDGIPESVVVGAGLLTGTGVSVAVVSAVFLANVPEALAATSGLARSGWSAARILGLWGLVTVACGLASLAGYALLDGAAPETLAFVLAFAGGAVLTMLAAAMIPEAYERGGHLAGLCTSLGFGVAFAITALE